jgi:hypothetical protein
MTAMDGGNAKRMPGAVFAIHVGIKKGPQAGLFSILLSYD